MAGRKRKKQSYAAVVGLVGSGSVSIKSAKSHLSDFIEAQDGEILWVLPHTADVTKSLAKVKDFLWDEDAKFALVSDGTDEDDDWEDNAQSTVEVDEDVFASLVTEVAGYEAETLAVLFILDDESDADLELLDAAQDENLKCFDLASGITELELAEVEEEVGEPEEDEDDESPVAEEAEEDETTSDEEEHRPPFSAKVQKAIDKGNYSRAGELLAEELGSDGVKELAEEFGLTFKKGTWAKSIGKGIAEHVAGEVPEKVEPKEEHISQRVSREANAARKASEKKPSAADEKAPADEEPEIVKESATLQDRPTAAPAPALHDADLIYFLAQIAASQGTAEAKAFFTFINDKFPRD